MLQAYSPTIPSLQARNKDSHGLPGVDGELNLQLSSLISGVACRTVGRRCYSLISTGMKVLDLFEATACPRYRLLARDVEWGFETETCRWSRSLQKPGRIRCYPRLGSLLVWL